MTTRFVMYTWTWMQNYTRRSRSR